jgi:hypothetical protein
MPEPAPAPISVSQSQLEHIAEELKTIKSQTATKKDKDGWDKAGVIAQFVSGGIIATLGIIVTFMVSRGQEQATNRQQAFNYMSQVFAAKDAKETANLLSMINIAISPDEAVGIAARYASGDQDPQVRQAALRALRKLGTKPLNAMIEQHVAPNNNIAAGLLGKNIWVQLRVSDVKNYGVIVLNGTPFCSVKFGEDSNWMNLNDKQDLQAGINNVVFCVRGGPSGYSGRMNISVGSYQHVIQVSDKKASSNGPAFHVLAHLSVEGKVGKDGSVTTEVEEPTIYPVAKADDTVKSCSGWLAASPPVDCTTKTATDWPEPQG